MKSKINFKNGLKVGAIIGILLIGIGYVVVSDMMDKSSNISSFDLNELSYQTLSGEGVHLSDYKGKFVLVNFWATWCAPCIQEFPVLNETYNLVKDDFEFVMVSYESIDKIKSFHSKRALPFTFLKSNNFILEGITTVPQTFILDHNGNNIHHHPAIFSGNATSIADSLYQWVK